METPEGAGGGGAPEAAPAETGGEQGGGQVDTSALAG